MSVTTMTVEAKTTKTREKPTPKNGTTVQETVFDYGAKGNGISDDTEAIQRALDSSEELYIPDGTYMIDATTGLRPRSNQTIRLSENAVLKVIPNSSVYYHVFDIEDVSNVTIAGGTLVGDRYAHNGTEGEWGFGVLISSNTRNIVVRDMVARDFWGDGYYIGGNTSSLPTDILLENVTSDNNRRQGLSITQARNVIVRDSVFKNTNGTAPEAGIDIEPNENDLVENITIINTALTGNRGGGIDIFGELGTVRTVTITGSRMEGNHTGLYLSQVSGLQVENSVISRNTYVGIDLVRDVQDASFASVTIEENALHGVSLITSGQDTGTRNVEFIGSRFINNGQNDPQGKDGIRIDNYDGSSIIENIRFTGCIFEDNQNTSTQRYGITVSFGSGISNVIVDSDCVFAGNSDGDYLGI